MTSYIYAFSVGPYLKIGHSRKPRRRLSEVQIGTPYKATMCFVVAVAQEDAKEIEQRVHHLLKHCWQKGEWFKVSARQAEAAVHGAIAAQRTLEEKGELALLIAKGKPRYQNGRIAPTFSKEARAYRERIAYLRAETAGMSDENFLSVSDAES